MPITPLVVTTTYFDPKVTPWQVKREDMPAGNAQARLRHLVRYAVLAPSTHNTQPWQFEVKSNEIRLYANRTRWLKIADADERELYVSLGCALENLLVAAEHFGYAHAVTLLPDVANRDWVAAVQLSGGGMPSLHRAGLFDCIPARFSNHKLYNGAPVDPNLLLLLQGVCVEAGIKPMLITDAATRQTIDELVVRADAVQFADPDFREELGHWMGQGMFGTSWLMSKLQQMAVTLINIGESTAKHDSQVLMSSPVFGVITSQEDDRKSQVQAGQAYERLHLLATRLRLGMQPMNQLLQQRYFKSALSDVLFADRLKLTPISAHQTSNVSPTPQMAFRLGYGEPEAEHTPRRPLEEVLKEVLHV
jgi:nitroreductase